MPLARSSASGLLTALHDMHGKIPEAPFVKSIALRASSSPIMAPKKIFTFHVTSTMPV